VCSSSAETSRKFRKQILDQCQQEFQKSNTDEDKIKILEEQLKETSDADKKIELTAELEDTKFQTRRRSLGNVRFIGELYKLKMLTPKIMVECVMMLLSKLLYLVVSVRVNLLCFNSKFVCHRCE